MLPAMKAHGVPWLRRHLAGEITLAEAAEGGKADTRRYTKRQVTWFRHQMPGWTAVAPDAVIKSVMELARVNERRSCMADDIDVIRRTIGILCARTTQHLFARKPLQLNYRYELLVIEIHCDASGWQRAARGETVRPGRLVWG